MAESITLMWGGEGQFNANGARRTGTGKARDISTAGMEIRPLRGSFSELELHPDTCRFLPKRGMVLNADHAPRIAGKVTKIGSVREMSKHSLMLAVSACLSLPYVRCHTQADAAPLFEAGKVKFDAKVGTHYNQGRAIGHAVNG